ncbi:DsbA family protein [Mycobacterium sp.]|uniref:DsbA family protein n=1 Tax=Mycobacterium sp. TaxID=1785 RepID=UPI003D6A74CE
MRWWLGTLAVLVVCFVTIGMATTYAEVPRSDDGYGAVVGSAGAPVQLEIFCEPQCPHCAQFESSYGQQIAGYLASGRLAVTYRWLTFLDDKHHNDASAQISNALLLAADPATPAAAYQAFVQDLYSHQSPDGPDNNDIAEMARQSGVPEPVATRIAAGDPGVDAAAMDNVNTALLKGENPQGRTTPTVYHLNAKNVVDLQDPDWLDKLVG